MKNSFLFLSIFILSLYSTNLFSQAYDGSGDSKIFLGYANIGGLSGAEFQFDSGLSDLVSYGGKITFLFDANKKVAQDQFEETQNAFNSFDLGLFLRFHFSETFKMSEKIDPYIGLDASLKNLGAHGGLKYSFSETLGVYAQYSHSFSGSLWGSLKDEENNDDTDIVNYFGKQGTFSLGLTINL